VLRRPVELLARTTKTLPRLAHGIPRLTKNASNKPTIFLVELDYRGPVGASLPGAHGCRGRDFLPRQARQATDEAARGDRQACKERGAVLCSAAWRRRWAASRRASMIFGALEENRDQPLPLGTTSVRVAEKSEDAIFPQTDVLLDQPGALEALAEAAIRKGAVKSDARNTGFKSRSINRVMSSPRNAVTQKQAPRRWSSLSGKERGGRTNDQLIGHACDLCSSIIPAGHGSPMISDETDDRAVTGITPSS